MHVCASAREKGYEDVGWGSNPALGSWRGLTTEALHGQNGGQTPSSAGEVSSEREGSRLPGAMALELDSCGLTKGVPKPDPLSPQGKNWRMRNELGFTLAHSLIA